LELFLSFSEQREWRALPPARAGQVLGDQFAEAQPLTQLTNQNQAAVGSDP
jgi:hypothetical protein